MKKTIIILVLIFGLCVPNLSVKAFTVTVNKMRIIMNVSESGLVSIDTTMDVNFGFMAHGIYVYVPQDYKMTWTKDGKSVTKSYHWPIINLKVYNGEPYQRTLTDGNLYLRMGDPEVQISGNKSYHYSYDIQMKDLGLGGIQLLYMDLVGTGWELPFTEVEYQITLPKGWPQDIFLYQGPQGSTATIQTYTIDQNVLKGTASNLAPHEGLTIYTVLSQEGSYFTFPKVKDYSIFIILSSLVLLIAMYWIFQKYGKDRPLIITPQFGPIKGLSSSQIGYVIDGTVTPQDMVSVIIEWAYKGYLKIYDNDKSVLVKLEKLKPIPETENEADKALFNTIFYERDNVTIEKLQESIHETLHQAGNMIINDFESVKENRIFDVKSFATKFTLGIMATMPYFVLLVHQLTLNDNLTDGTSMALFFMIAIALGLLILWMKLIERWFTILADRTFSLVGLACGTGVVYIIGLFVATSEVNVGSLWILIKFVLVSVMTTITAAMALLMDRRSQRGTDLFGQILGLKNFIELAEKDRIIALAEEEPSYFYKLLPYAYILGITETWIRKFKSLTVPQPNWYISEKTFSPNDLTFRLMNELHSIKFDMPSFKASQEVGGALLEIGGAILSSGVRGGGHSGGGFGGGGGGHW